MKGSPDLLWRERLVDLIVENQVEAYVEVGVLKGKLSMAIGQLPEVSEMWLIDPWVGQDQMYFDVVEAMVGCGENVRILRMRSEEVAPLFPDHSVDFVFIDGDHSYEAVSRDIRLWKTKVRPGGILAGDDYLGDDKRPAQVGVRRAVDEFGGCSHISGGKRQEKRIWWKRL